MTDANRCEKKDQVLKTYTYCLAELSIKCLFIHMLWLVTFWLAFEWYTHMLHMVNM